MSQSPPVEPNQGGQPTSPSPREKGQQQGAAIYQSMRLSSVGLELGLSVVIGVLGGGFIGEKLGDKHLGQLIGIILGFSAGLRSLFRLARRVSEASAAEREMGLGLEESRMAETEREDR
ncbi:MAG: AtpZ/AtpI family protein [Myxococcota bacterium]|nr:AtpZ/AtpI family protein [Myxococcota bacterium]